MTVNHGVPGSSPGEGAKAICIRWLFSFPGFLDLTAEKQRRRGEGRVRSRTFEPQSHRETEENSKPYFDKLSTSIRSYKENIR
jgi:hypothetical protein